MNGGAAQDCWRRIGTWGDRSCPELAAHVHCRNCPVYSENAARLLDAPVAAAYLRENARHYAQAKTAVRPGAKSAVVFRLAREWLALPTEVFREIAPARPIHSLPHRPDRTVLGVANVRGELLVCVSLAAALGIDGGPGAEARLAVIGRGSDRFAFPADEVAGLHRYDDAALAPVPATLAHARAVYTRGLFAWDGRSVGVLDAELLFHTLNRSLA